MTAAIVHYHLRTGGVSSVIIRASRALTAAGIRHVILSGEAPEEAHAGLPVQIVPELGYRQGPPDVSLASLLRSAATTALGRSPDLWYFHNHSLGKNPSLPTAVAELALSGERLLLQIHDLAEHGRPAGYQNIPDKSVLYPVSPRIRYAFLNERDRHAFLDAGLPAANSVVLVNPIEPEPADPADSSSPPIVFAPIRGIRRKNLGELLLLSAIAPRSCRFAVSRAPRDPYALTIHDTWRDFAKRHRLPVDFDVSGQKAPQFGANPSFESWVRHATHFISTSIEEGFGLPFLEAVAWRKPLIGRRLPVARDLHRNSLYDRLLIPAEWVELPLLRDQLTNALERDFRAFGRRLSATHLSEAMEKLQQDGWFDFGNLSEPLQQGIIERIATPANRNIPLVETDGHREPAADWLARVLSQRTPSAANLADYSTAAWLDSLKRIHADLASAEAAEVSFLSATRLLDGFLAPEHFHFLLSSPPRTTKTFPFRAVVFDIYGTLLIAPAGGVKPDPAADAKLRDIIHQFGYDSPESPSTEIHAAVARHHASSGVPYPEVDLRVLWREVLSIEPCTETTALVTAIEEAWHPAKPMPGAEAVIQRLSRSGVSLGILSNAQCNTLPTLGGIADLFAPELTLLSYQHGIAKPSQELFQMMADRLAGRGIRPHETLYIGNDPLHDIVPASLAGFQTALFAGDAESLRPGECSPDLVIHRWEDLLDPRWWKMRAQS